MSSSERNAKIYGAVETETFMTFEGFCKKIYDTKQQEVEVFIDDKKIDVIPANQKISNIEDTYEVFDTEGFCFTYKLPKEFIGEKHKLEFKTIDGEQLIHSPIITIEKDNPLFNRGLLIQSLDEIINYNSIKDGYKKNTLSFMAIEENLKDNFFIEYILQICKLYKNLQLNIIYFKDTQKNSANELFKQIKNKFFSNPSNIKEIISDSEIYLHNDIEEFEFTTNQQFYNKVKDSEIIRNNLFIIELTKKAKNKEDLSKIILSCSIPISFEESIICEIFKDHKGINEFKFINSLSRVDEEKIKDIYCPNSIGFLATEENLNDKQFVSYIKELRERFPKLNLKALYFDVSSRNKIQQVIKVDNLEIISLNNLETLLKVSFTFIFNAKTFESYNIPLWNLITSNCKNIHTFVYDYNWINKEIDLDTMNRFNYLFKSTKYESQKLSESKTLYELWFYDSIEYALNSQSFIINNFNFRNSF